MRAERVLRAAALLIALLALADPALTRAARVRPTVVVLQGSAAERVLAGEVARVLETAFEVSRVDLPAAAAYVVVGDDLPEGWRPTAGSRVFAVTDAPGSPAVRILRVAAPDELSLDSVAPIVVDLRVAGTGDRSVTVTIAEDGVRLSRVTARLSGDQAQVRAPLTFVPSRPGLVRLRVEAMVEGSGTAVADTALEVTSRHWRVLAFDGRPNYPATFIRRALEADPRFVVSTRVVTSRVSAIQTNTGPSSLTVPGALAPFDLIIVGATDGLGADEAAALRQYLRERHGAVALLAETTAGALVPELTGQPTWNEDRRIEAVPVSPASQSANETWSASEFLWPARWPPLAMPLASLAASDGGAPGRAAVWQMPIGGGRLIVSSAVDGWRSRAGTASGFSAFWRATAAAAAHATPPAIDVTLPRRLLVRGERVEIAVEMFTAGEPSARVTGGADGGSTVRLWPSDEAAPTNRREWTGAFRAPDVSGRYRLEVAGRAGDSSVAEFLVADSDGADDPVRPALDRDGLSALAAASHGGAVIPASQLASLAPKVADAVNMSPAREAWYPMRAIWWLAPFTLCAAGEWWLRRHRGER